MPAGNLYTPHLDSRDLIADFYPRLEAANETLWANALSTDIPSDRGTEELNWLGQVPQLRRAVGGRHEEVLNKYSLTITNFKYESTLPISEDDLRRDKTGQIRQRVADLAVRTATHWNTIIGSLIAAGEAATQGLAYDGQFFFDTDHNESGTSQTNDLTATEVPSANVSTTSVLTSTEAANIITETIGYMMTLTDDKGELINQGATDVVIICTKVGHFVGLQNALSLNNLSTGTDNNPVLGIRARGFNIRVEFVPSRVTAADKLYFFFGNGGMGAAPIVRTEEYGVRTQLIGAGSEEAFKNFRYLFGVDSNRGIAYGMWQKAALVTLS